MGTYPIGSTYKPFMALAGLEYGLRKASDVTYDPGYFELAGHRFRNAGSAAFGSVNLHRSLVVSSDTYYYSLASEMGVDRIHAFMKPFGFGQITGIDLEGEKAGVLPSTEWKRSHYKKPADKHWYNGETVSVGVGQGYNSFTILQLAQATAVLANNGTYMRPHVVKSILPTLTHDEILTVPQASYTIPLHQEHIDVVKKALAEVNRVGTARRAFSGAAYAAAGKTGTAQVYSLRGEKYRASEVDERLRDHALFMSFAPVDNPQIAVALLVENAGWGASIAAPLARSIFDYWLVNRFVPGPLYEVQNESGDVQVAQQALPMARATNQIVGEPASPRAVATVPARAAGNTAAGGAGPARGALAEAPAGRMTGVPAAGAASSGTAPVASFKARVLTQPSAVPPIDPDPQ